MRKVGFITTPLSSGHAVRGIGFYTRRLLAAMNIQCSKFNIQLIEIKNLLDLESWTLDLIHYPFFDLFFHTLPIFRPAKTVVTIHDVIPLEFPDHYPPGWRGWFNLQLQKLALSGVERVITDSRASQKAIARHLRYPVNKTSVIYLAADAKFRPLRDEKVLGRVQKKYQLPSRFVLYVGDVNWNKNIPGLVAACRLAKLPLVIVGKNAAGIEKMNLNHAELRHLQGLDWSGVKRLGWVDDEDLVAIFNLASVYCKPSFAEGFGLAVLEAMACGTAVAVSRTHSLPEIAGDAAFYFDPYNMADMARAILEAKADGVAAQAQKFSWEKTARQTLEIYTQLI